MWAVWRRHIRFWVIVVTFYRPKIISMRPLQLLLGTETCFLSPLPACRVTVSMKSQPIYRLMWLTHHPKISSVKFSFSSPCRLCLRQRNVVFEMLSCFQSGAHTLNAVCFAGSLWQHPLNQHVGGWRAPRTPKKKKIIWFPFQKRAAVH